MRARVATKRRVQQLDLDGNEIACYQDLNEASQGEMSKHKGISKAINGDRNTYYGYVWRYHPSDFYEIDKDTVPFRRHVDFPNYRFFENMRVWSDQSRCFMSPRIKGGYPTLHLINKYKNGVTKSAHIFMCECWHGRKPYPSASVDHIDRDSSNWCVENLRWASKQEQIQNRRPFPKTAPISRRAVEQIDSENGQVIATFESISAAALFAKLSKLDIGNCCRKTRKSAGDYFWQFAEEEIECSDLPGEIWSVFHDCSHHFASNLGRIKRQFHKKWYLVHDRERRPLKTGCQGYIYVTYTNDEGEARKTFVHRVVWAAFNGAITEGYVIDHMAEHTPDNKQNNCLTNLQCITSADNTRLHHTRKRKREEDAQKDIAVEE
jgi:hypothetical protein